MNVNGKNLFSRHLLAIGALTLLPWVVRAETLTALGRVLPRSGVVDINGVTGDTIVAVNVKEGDWVEPGQSLARLSSAGDAAKKVSRAEADLAALKVSTAQDLEIARQRVVSSEAESKFAQERFDRIYAARNSEFMSPDQLEDRSLAKQNSALKLLQVRQDLEKATRDVDKLLRGAEADLGFAQAQLAVAEVRSPIKARVLKIRGRVGATVGRTEIAKLGDTSAMIVVTEVYEADALKVKPGQKVTVSSGALPKKMSGVISSVSSLIYRNSIESLDPNDNAQSRIVEATVQMDEAKPLDQLVLLQVDVNIAL